MGWRDECQVFDICSYRDGSGAPDTEHGDRDPAMNREQITIALILLALVLIGNLGGLLWVLNW